MIIAFTVMVMVSCKSDFEKNKDASELATIRFKSMDTTMVDVYPQFDGCDELEISPDCFHKNLHQLIKQKLLIDTLHMEIKSSDSFMAQFTISKNGQIRYDSITQGAQHLDKSYIDSVFQNRFVNLPGINSALKQGTPVSSSYQVPIVIKPVLIHTGQ